jgi:hypothetical protein
MNLVKLQAKFPVRANQNRIGIVKKLIWALPYIGIGLQSLQAQGC